MKNKFWKYLLCLILLPVLVLAGCGDNTYYSYSIQSSSTYGSVSGVGFTNGKISAKKGSTVSIKATPHQNSSFLAWIYQGNELISRNPTYNFTASNENVGTYIALFDEDKILYSTLTNINFEVVNGENITDPSLSITVSVGENVNTYRDIYSAVSPISVQDGRETSIDVSTKQVMKLSSKTTTNETSYLYRVSLGGSVVDNYTDILYYSDATSTTINYFFEDGSYTTTHDILDGTDVIARLSLTFKILDAELIDSIFES